VRAGVAGPAVTDPMTRGDGHFGPTDLKAMLIDHEQETSRSIDPTGDPIRQEIR
jgi:hypothetical protein